MRIRIWHRHAENRLATTRSCHPLFERRDDSARGQTVPCSTAQISDVEVVGAVRPKTQAPSMRLFLVHLGQVLRHAKGLRGLSYLHQVCLQQGVVHQVDMRDV
eukprot:4098227-Pyramimonas_sp.AAC.1